ncbi:MAG: hypothetical protein ACYS18_10405 [Planctomycetota bacterium]|jgi:hypothetical protein
MVTGRERRWVLPALLVFGLFFGEPSLKSGITLQRDKALPRRMGHYWSRFREVAALRFWYGDKLTKE